MVIWAWVNLSEWAGVRVLWYLDWVRFLVLVFKITKGSGFGLVFSQGPNL